MQVARQLPQSCKDKRPLLYVPFLVAAALLLPAVARVMSALGFH